MAQSYPFDQFGGIPKSTKEKMEIIFSVPLNCVYLCSGDSEQHLPSYYKIKSKIIRVFGD